jgi:hypothetical protein
MICSRQASGFDVWRAGAIVLRSSESTWTNIFRGSTSSGFRRVAAWTSRRHHQIGVF